MGDYGLKVGTPDVKSVGAIAFGPDGVLFVADSFGAKVLAIDVADTGKASGKPFELENLETQLCSFLGCERDDLVLRDMDVHPASGNVYLSVSRGRGSGGAPLLLRIDASDGSIDEIALKDISFSESPIGNAPNEDQEMRGQKMRSSTVTDMAYVDGTLLVAGMSNEEFSSNLRRIPFPFRDEMKANSLQIFHVSHGAYETAAPIRTFVPYHGNESIVASYTCTPLVKFTLGDVQSGTQAKGETVAELGAGNQPIDMVSFNRDDGEFLLISNSRHPLMKVNTADIDKQDALTVPRGPAGVPFEALPQAGVTKLARLDDARLLLMQRDESGNTNLRTVETASL